MTMSTVVRSIGVMTAQLPGPRDRMTQFLAGMAPAYTWGSETRSRTLAPMFITKPLVLDPKIRFALVGGRLALKQIEHWSFANPDPGDATIEQASYDEEPPATDGREGLHSLETLIAAYLSARDGRRVALPLGY